MEHMSGISALFPEHVSRQHFDDETAIASKFKRTCDGVKVRVSDIFYRKNASTTIILLNAEL
jgi:hypothetical protein